MKEKAKRIVWACVICRTPYEVVGNKISFTCKPECAKELHRIMVQLRVKRKKAEEMKGERW
jgi:hypothetical protein